MGTQSASLYGTIVRHRRLNVALTRLALCCAAVIEALHGHACTGDGCALCLAAAFASTLLLASIGVAFALPVMRALVESRTLRVGILPRRESRTVPMASSRARRVELTPVTMGVRLII